jgi:hypothetical protein
VLVLVRAEDRHLARRAAMAAHEPAADDDPRAHPLAGQHADDVVDPGCDAPPAFADHGEVAVVLERHRRAQAARERRPELGPRRQRAAVEHLPALGVHPAGASHADRQQAGACDPRRPQRSGRRSACQRHPVAVPVDEGELLGEDLAAEVGHRGSDLDLADVQPQHVTRPRPERQPPRRPAARPPLAVVVGLLDPAEAHEIVGHRVDRRPREARGGHQLGHPDRAGAAQRVQDKAGVEAAQQFRRRDIGHVRRWRRCPGAAD